MDYRNIEEIFNAGITNMTALRDIGRDDDSCFNYSVGVNWLKIKGTLINTMYISSNSYFGFNGSNEHFKLNRRDAQSKVFYKEIGSVYDGLYNFVKFRWVGFTDYAGSCYDKDNYALTYDIVFFDSGDICVKLISLGSSGSYTGTFSFSYVSLDYTKPTLNSPYISFYSQDEDNNTYTVDYNILKVDLNNKYLIESNNNYFSLSEDGITDLSISELTANDFITYGFSDKNLINTFISELKDRFELIKIYNWCSFTTLVPTAKLKATPLPQSVITNDIKITDSSIVDIQNITSSCEGSPKWFISIDNGITWEFWDGTSWSDSQSGASISEISSIDSSVWNDKFLNINTIKMKILLNSSVDKFINIFINFNNVSE